MERIAVESREIAVVGYAEETSTLEVTFRRGGVYRYREVPSGVYRQLMEAPSLGTFFAQQIKDRYPYEKVH
ncbi:MAG: KTSC domain-containing protein [Candidatus Omnitrophota bacterium]